jgi:methyl-accepting chemotaxis protein
MVCSYLMGQLDRAVNIQMAAIRNMTLADMMHDGMRGVVAEALVGANQKDDAALAELEKEITEKSDDFIKYIGALDALELNAETKSAISETKPALQKYVEQSKGLVKVAREKGYAEGYALFPAFSESFTLLEGKMEKLGEMIESDAHSDLSTGAFFQKINLVVAITTLLLGGLAASWVLSRLMKELKGFIAQIRDAGNSVHTASEKMTETSKNASSVSASSAASLQETVASLEELNSMVKINADNAQQASALSQSSLNAAQTGKTEIMSLISTMSDLEKSSKKMEEIINVIDDIAFQTNLLALNAAVEAARAGDQGKGFAVVADAVRTLAQRSAVAAKDISQMIQASVDKISFGNGVATRSGTSLENIVSSVTKVSDLNTEIAGASKEQSAGLGQISTAMHSLDQSTQQNAQASEEINHSSRDMLHQSEELEGLVRKFEVMALGSNSQKAS